MGWEIVAHSFGLVLRNLGAALRASLAPLVLALVLSLAGLALIFGPGDWRFPSLRGEGSGLPQPSAGRFVLGWLLGFVGVAFCLAWVAVSWHRFVLLAERPGVLPSLRGRPVWRYVGRFVVVTVVVVLAALPLLFVAGLVVGAASDGGLPPLGLLVGIDLVLGVILTFIGLRIGVVLPGTALRQPLGIGAGWRATAPASGAILVAAAILTGLNIGASLALGLLPMGWPGEALRLAVNWLSLMVGISFLTTLYGHLVERRPLG